MGKSRAERRERRKRAGVLLMAAEAMPTSERLRQAGQYFVSGGDKRTGRIFRMMDAPLEKLATEGKLSEAQYEVLARLRMHWTLAQLAGSPQSVDLNRIGSHEFAGLGQGERETYHRQQFEAGWQSMVPLERGAVGSVVLNEIALAVVGAALGYRSPYRGRVAALELLHSGAGKLASVWRV